MKHNYKKIYKMKKKKMSIDRVRLIFISRSTEHWLYY